VAWETPQAKLVQRLRREGLADERVLAVLARVPRDVFIAEEHRHLAFADEALPIGWHQTISQPSVVAAMTRALNVQPAHHLLEIGTGSGYQAAILAELGASVVTIERNHYLAAEAQRVLAYLGYGNVEVVEGDGTLGWPARAPYDRILVAAAAPGVPPALLDQLSPGGRLVIPVGGRRDQQLIVVEKNSAGAWRERTIGPVRFVSLIGAHGWPDD
jgi:protein-L-isoaspartate(D-aspartate) O-methyltransferase